MKTLFVIDSSVIGPEYIVKAAKEMNLNVLFLTNLNSQEGDALSQLTSYKFINCNTNSFEELYEIIKTFPKEDIAGVISFLDSKLEICSKLCSALDIKGIDPKIELLKDKAYVNDIIPEFTPLSLSFTTGAIPYSEIKKMLSASQNGLILKPSFAAGAKGISVLEDENDIENIEKLFDKTLPKHLHPDEYVVQEIIDGELVSLEGYVLESKVIPIGVTGRRKTENAESVFIFPYHSIAQKELCKIVQTLVERSGYSRGFFHTEFIVSENQVKLIDCNFGRPGGANITEIIACSYGIEPHSIYRQSMELVLNEKEIIPTAFWGGECKESLGIAYGIPNQDRVLEIKYAENMKSKHTQAQNLGDTVSAMGSSNWSWLGMLSGLKEDVIKDVDSIRVKTLHNGWIKPVYYNMELKEPLDYLEKV
ncbi:ATP-grasp domain-containing protein [Bacillus siamensis]|uniref:ATP-grasp domain-containing protein n=1 Tax=Bacillus siamensis TaxID=659243 RepID=A0AAI8HRB6_9BACI|nr:MULTISPECIES: ATP-grasp domain-containing protein [Bacillus]AME06196.1 hypothetical protein AUL54_07465 [Bacillus sp. SDLI1]AUJ78694.1 ATP-grasp domain-containing protein [Bacillus siamensis]UUA84874.1 ATP-grasp domain-containing protein [Bacillus siamensis]